MSTRFVMEATNSRRRRGRPRLFDPEDAVAVSQVMFHQQGFDAVSVAQLTALLGINPPSFYAAFGSKLGLYEQVLERYTRRAAIPLARVLQSDRPVAESLAALLDEAARRYADDPGSAGCLVLEGIRCNDQAANKAARAYHMAAERTIHRYIAERHPEEAERLTDFVCTTMIGLSSSARNGHSRERLAVTAQLASLSINLVLDHRVVNR